MTPRLARSSDLQTVVDITTRAYAPYEKSLGATPVPVTENYAPGIAQEEVWLLEDAQEPIGLIVLEDRGECSLLYSVAVEPDRQGLGIGRHLLGLAEEIARMRNHRTLALFTNAKMERNIRIYREYGFLETRRRAHPTRPGWVLVDMEKALTASI